MPGKGSVGGGETVKKAKMTLDAGGKSVSEKSQATPGLQEPLLEIKKWEPKFDGVGTYDL